MSTARQHPSPTIAIGQAVCGAFGIDADKVTGLTLSVNVHEAPTLTVEYLAIGVDADAIGTTLAAYEITPKVAAPWPPPKRTMDPREIVTGDVRRMTCKVTHTSVRYHGITVQFGDGFSKDYGYPVVIGRMSMRLVSRPMWGDQ